MKRRIIAAETTPQQDRLDEVLDGVEDDFSYVIEGLKMMGRRDNKAIDNAIAIAHDLEAAVQVAMQAVAGNIQGGTNEEV